MNVLELNHVKKTFNNETLHVLKDISLSVGKGEVVAIIGPSGSGKSTLLRCATLLTDMDSGELRYMGDYAAKNDASGKAVYAGKAELKKIRSRFGLVFQSFNLFPHYSVLRNLTDAQVNVLKRSKSEAREKAMVLLGKMGLADKADAYPCQLSGGQQQRVAIARALAMDPEILFFDEPLSPRTTSWTAASSSNRATPRRSSTTPRRSARVSFSPASPRTIKLNKTKRSDRQKTVRSFYVA